MGITGKDFTLLGASKAAMRGVTILKDTDDKTRVLNPHTLMAFSGEAGDTGMFFVWAVVQNGWCPTTTACSGSGESVGAGDLC